eukprot:scaffold177009_cov27-Prasinocladus_malaysianus.AAC.4
MIITWPKKVQAGSVSHPDSHFTTKKVVSSGRRASDNLKTFNLQCFVLRQLWTIIAILIWPARQGKGKCGNPNLIATPLACTASGPDSATRAAPSGMPSLGRLSLAMAASTCITALST